MSQGAELAGLALVVAGVAELLGLGAALIAGGISVTALAAGWERR